MKETLELVSIAIIFLALGVVQACVIHVAKLEQENRQLIQALEANYASNADFRRLCK